MPIRVATGPADGADGGKQPEESFPEVNQRKEATPDVPKAKTTGRNFPAKSRKMPLAPPRQHHVEPANSPC